VDLRRLEVFCRVVDLKSFTKAAAAARLSQPSVSDHIRLLEEEVGEKLLDRLGRETLPTPAGKILYRYAARMLKLRDEVKQSLSEFRGHLSGTLIIGASTIPGTYLLPRITESFQLQHPDVRIKLQVGGTEKIAEDVRVGHVELGMVGARWKDPRLTFRETSGDELVLAVPPGHPWARRRSVRADELGDIPLIIREEGSGTLQVMTEALAARGLDLEKLRVVAEFGSTEAIRQGIKHGLGASILSSLAVHEDHERGALRIIPMAGGRILRSFYLIRRKSREATPLAQAFWDHFCREEPTAFAGKVKEDGGTPGSTKP